MDEPLTTEQQQLALLRVLVQDKGWTVIEERITDVDVYLIISRPREPGDLEGYAAGMPK